MPSIWLQLHTYSGYLLLTGLGVHPLPLAEMARVAAQLGGDHGLQQPVPVPLRFASVPVSTDITCTSVHRVSD